MIVIGSVFVLWPKPDSFSGAPKNVGISDNGLEFSFQDVPEKTVGDFLVAHGLGFRQARKANRFAARQPGEAILHHWHRFKIDAAARSRPYSSVASRI